MKTRQVILISIAVTFLFSMVSAFAADSKKSKTEKDAADRVEVVFQDPDKYADAKDSSMDTDKGRAYVLEEIKTFVQKTAIRYLPAGHKFHITFTEVDLAGEYEPWRHGSARDVRIVKDIYPPRFDFSYKVTDEKGAVVSEGKEQLRDISYMTRMVIDRHDTLRYEKDMINDWLRKTLPAPAK